MSIKKTLRLALIAFSIIPITIITIFTYQLISERLVTFRKENLSQLSTTNSNGLEAYIDIQKAEVNLLSIQTEITNFVLKEQLSLSKDLYLNEYLKVTELLTTRRNLYPSCKNISIYNSAFKVIASSDNKLLGKKITNTHLLSSILTTGKPASEVSIFDDNSNQVEKSYYTEFGSPIFDNSNEIIGYIVSTVSLTYFNDFLDSIKIGETGYVIVLDENGYILYHPVNTLVGTLMKDNELISKLHNYINNDQQINGVFEHRYDHNDNIFSYSFIPDLNWTFIVKQETSEVNDAATIILFVLLWGLIITLFFIVFFSSRFTSYFTKPILDLRDTMRIASSGNLNVTSTISNKNELGELSKSFNKMIHIIKTNYDDLTQMHNKLIDKEEELHENYERIAYQAYHDILTKLPNKLAFYEKVNNIIKTTSDHSLKHAVLFIDLDNFKNVNDTLGHSRGDELLVQTALKLSSIVDDNNLLARSGGDEFLIFCENIMNEDTITSFALDILNEFKNPFIIQGELIYITLSIGIAIYPQNGFSSDELIKNSDIAMYKSKETGKNKVTIFDKSMEEELSRNSEIREVLRHAIENNEVFLMYQPQVSITTKEVIGFEALMRIYNPKLGLISPAEFIPIAEESGLIVDLGAWALKEACKFTKNLLDTLQRPCRVSVNISSVQLNKSDFFSTLTEILDETDLPPECLELEITESILLSSLMDVTTLLKNFQTLGVNIALDDFGTGFSSLNYLTKIPINTLKIDKSFIDNICTSKKDTMIAETIIRLAHSLEIKVIAEGVEDINQWQLLETNQCDLIQGYLFSRPLNSYDLPKFLHSLTTK